jgi:hypothetical protein
MLRPLPVLMVATMTVSGCSTISESRLNPLNWLGSSGAPVVSGSEPLVPPEALSGVVDLRVPMTVTGVEVARTDSGALVTVTGVAPAPGYYNAQLVRAGIDGGILVLRLVAEAPATPVSGAREITVATSVSNTTLAGVTGVRVEGAGGGAVGGVVTTAAPPRNARWLIR